VSERLIGAIRSRLDRDGTLPCAAAFRVAEAIGVEPLEVGQTADGLGIKLSRCQLGLFGYGPKAEGRHKVVRPAERVDPGLAQAIRDSLVEGKLACRTAWEIAEALRIPKMEVAAAAEALGVKIFRCQLGAF